MSGSWDIMATFTQLLPIPPPHFPTSTVPATKVSREATPPTPPTQPTRPAHPPPPPLRPERVEEPVPAVVDDVWMDGGIISHGFHGFTPEILGDLSVFSLVEWMIYL